MRESSDVTRAQETLETYKAQLKEIEADIEAEIAGLEAGAAPPTRPFTTLEIRPKKTHVVPERVVLVWRPAELRPVARSMLRAAPRLQFRRLARSTLASTLRQ